jgi:hypothetical protein
MVNTTAHQTTAEADQGSNTALNTGQGWTMVTKDGGAQNFTSCTTWHTVL